MKHLWILLGLLLNIAFVQADDKSFVKEGDNMPTFVITHDDGTQIASSSYEGKVILINFFATWCPPCQKELAEIKSTLWPKYKDNQQFVLLVIGREHNDAELNTYNKKKGFEFPLYPDKDRSIYSKFADSTIPRTYLIGKDGKVIHAGNGFRLVEFDELMNKIEKALNR